MSSDGTRPSVSFTLQKKSQPPKVRPTSEEEDKKDFVLSLVGNQIESTRPKPKEKEYVIPLKKKRPLSPGGDQKVTEKVGNGGDGGGGGGGPVKRKRHLLAEKGDIGGTKEGKTEEELSLDKEAALAVLRDVQEAELRQRRKGEESDEENVISLIKPLGDVKDVSRPQSSMEEYQEMPIGEFGKALLRGMGWKQGMSLGKTNKGIIEPIEFIAQPQGLGLGAMPKQVEPPKKKNSGKIRIKKQGEEERKVQVPYVDKDGRVKHIKNIGEPIPKQPLRGFVVGNFARVMVGPHGDLYGQITKVEEKSKHVLLKMKINDQTLRFSQHHLELVSKEEYRLGRLLEEEEEDGKEEGLAGEEREKEYGLILKKRKGDDEKVSSSKEQKTNSPNHSKSSKKRKEMLEGKSGKLHDKLRTSASGSHSDVHVRHNDGRHYHGYQSKSSKVQKSQHVVKEKKLDQNDYWLTSNLKVKIVDRTYKKGRHYNTKVKIVDVISLNSCVCQTEDGRLLEGITQDMLETVVPRGLHSVVRVVRGKRKNNLATVVDQDRTTAEAVIQLNLSKEVMNVHFDDICEYLAVSGDDDYLD